jgi:sulfur-oxidizing protein SoxY
MFLTRRATLRLAAYAAGLLAIPASLVRALASTAVLSQTDVAEAIRAFTRGRKPVAGRIDLDVPVAADNANAVPINIRVDSPMTKASYCEEVLIVAERNPRPAACTFAFSPEISVPHLATRIRVAESQAIRVFARMSDGSVFMAEQDIIVTIGGCGE